MINHIFILIILPHLLLLLLHLSHLLFLLLLLLLLLPPSLLSLLPSLFLSPHLLHHLSLLLCIHFQRKHSVLTPQQLERVTRGVERVVIERFVESSIERGEGENRQE